MSSVSSHRGIAACITVGFLAASGLALAQQLPKAAPSSDGNTAPHEWRRVDAPPPDQQASAQVQGVPGAPYGVQNGGPGAAPDPYQPPPSSAPTAGSFPTQLTIRPGTYVTVRIDQGLSSDHNHAGDGFSGTLVQPIVVDGFVVAQRGQTVGGRIAEAQKAGRVEGVSRLAAQLTDLTAVDGQQVPVQSQLIRWNGPTSVGGDVAAVGGTTALGAAIGAAADWGRGAAIGAAAGAAAGLAGILLTRGHPTVIPPESVLTFQLQAPVTVNTTRAPQAFRWVEPGDYNQPVAAQPRPAPQPAPYAAYAPYPYPYAYPYPYYGGLWGPGFGFYYGPTFFYGRGYYRGGYYRGGYYHGGYYGHHH